METQNVSSSIISKVLSFLKINRQPKETQQQARISTAGGMTNFSGVVENPPSTDWVLPVNNVGIDPNQSRQLFSPGQPLPATGQPFQAARSFDYGMVTNTQLQPRSDEAIKFADLKMLADNCELVRLAIETRKDQMMKLEWNIIYRDPLQGDPNTDKRIFEMEKQLRYPDGEHNFSTWMSMLLDQMLTYDAATIYPHLNLDGSINRLLVVDGSTIKRVVDLWGRTPSGTEEFPDPVAYQQIIKGVPFVNFTKEELIYIPFCPRIDHMYGYSPVEQILYTANMFMRRQSLQMNYFTEGTLPDFFFELPLGWNPDQIDEFTRNFYETMAGNDKARRHGRFLPAGTKVNQTKNEMLKDDFDEWMARVVCFAFSLPPTAFVKQMSRASAEQAQEAAIEEGLAPLMIWFKGVMNHIILTYFKYDDLMFEWVESVPIDPLQAAQANKIYLELGTITKNEVRLQLGFDPTTDGDDAFIVTGSTVVLVEDVIAGNTLSVDPTDLVQSKEPKPVAVKPKPPTNKRRRTR